MVSPDIFYQIYTRLQEIKQNKLDYGGVCLLLFGDPCQLKPVQAGFPWEDPKHNKLTNDLEPMWDMFKPVLLRTNHRQGEDRSYGEMLDNFRVGDYRSKDMKTIQSRVFPTGDERIPSDSVYIFATNNEVNAMNEECLSRMEGEEYVSEARVHHPTFKNFVPKLETNGNIKHTKLQMVLKFKVGAKVMLTYNLRTTDGLTNGALGTIYGIELHNGSVREIHVNFLNPKVAREGYKQFPQLEKKYGIPCYGVRIHEARFGIGRESVAVKSQATAYQFPLKLAFAATCHKVK